MPSWRDRIERLDISLFGNIPSQTSSRDRRSLLAVQRAVARNHPQYAYLEIGSHLGGSIQPHLVDDRCTAVYSIDARPGEQLPDDRAPGFEVTYRNSTTERMLELLGEVADTGKITCFDLDAADVDPAAVVTPPMIAFIDGEHTADAVRSDFAFCQKVLDPDGVIVFHDFGILHATIGEICERLRFDRRDHLPLKLEGEVYAIFLDPRVVHDDPYLAALYRRQSVTEMTYFARLWVRRRAFAVKLQMLKYLPEPVIARMKATRRQLTRRRFAGAARWC